MGDGAARSRLGAAYVQVLLFMFLLLAGYVYVWRKGVLDWGRTERPIDLVASDERTLNGPRI